MAQFEISRDGGGDEVEAAKRVWRARFSLDVEPAGPVHALVSLVGDTTSVRMWAERPATAAQLRAGAGAIEPGAEPGPNLRPGDIVIRDGTPPQSSAAPRRAFPGSRAMSVETRNQLAVALHYDHTGAPRVVAKGKGTIGAKIIEVARAHDIPIEENEVLAGALSNVELGDEIPAELYKAVAEVLVFVLRLSGESARLAFLIVIVLPRWPMASSLRCLQPASDTLPVIHRRHALGLLAAASLLPSRSLANVSPQRSEFRDDLAKRFSDRGNRRHLRRLQGRRLPDHRQRQESFGRGQAAGLDLQDPEFADRAGDRRGRRTPTRTSSSGTG